MTRILYLAHDLDDPAIWRRRTMLQQGGAEVDLVGFRKLDGPLPAPARVLGQTHNARMIHRLWSVVKARARVGVALRGLKRPDVILARNLETLPLALAATRRFRDRKSESDGSRGRRPRVVYEVLDIHRLLLRGDAVGRSMRFAERRLMQGADLVLVSSPGFKREYFAEMQATKPPVHLVENRVVSTNGAWPQHLARNGPVVPDGPRVIGWFGILRCAASLNCLDAVTRAAPGSFRIVLRGRPAYDEIPEFDTVVNNNPDLVFGGPYAYPHDLLTIYGAVDLAWLVDRYDAGRNSDWLLPNRYYESGMSGVPPIGLAGTEVARQMQSAGIGLLLDDIDPRTVVQSLSLVTQERLSELQRAQRRVPQSEWVATPAEARALVARLLGEKEGQLDTAPEV